MFRYQTEPRALSRVTALYSEVIIAHISHNVVFPQLSLDAIGMSIIYQLHTIPQELLYLAYVRFVEELSLLR